ncbi:MAG: MBL fold metallo-hydrolase [Deltaproteobacteria bacterium]|nr:MBL fold metallo-hydrolase [Deltaproteobacteria bacterium]
MSDSVTFIGHSTLHIELDGFHFLTDANFSDRLLGIVKRIGTQAAIDVHNLPPVSALLVTHGAHDHLDIHTYKYFKQDRPIVAPQGLGYFIKRYLRNPCTELQGWGSHSFETVRITAVPARHHGFNIPSTRHIPPMGYILQGTRHTVFVSSDTSYGPHFSEIGKKFPIHIAALPIGHYHPRWLMGGRHMNPAEAINAFKDLKAEAMIPIHWGSFPISFEELSLPINTLKNTIRNTPLEDSVFPLNPGESLPFEALTNRQTQSGTLAAIYELKSS